MGKYVTLYHEWKDQKKLEKVKRAEIDHDLASIKGWKEDIVKYGKDVTLENKKMKAMKESLPVQKKNLDIEYARRIIKARQTHQKQREDMSKSDHLDAEAEAELKPLLMGLRPLQQKIVVSNRRITAAKVRARSVTLKMVG